MLRICLQSLKLKEGNLKKGISHILFLGVKVDQQAADIVPNLWQVSGTLQLSIRLQVTSWRQSRPGTWSQETQSQEPSSQLPRQWPEWIKSGIQDSENTWYSAVPQCSLGHSQAEGEVEEPTQLLQRSVQQSRDLTKESCPQEESWCGGKLILSKEHPFALSQKVFFTNDLN